MPEISVFLISFSLCLIINYILVKYDFLIDKKFFPHKSFVSQNSVPISGGLIFILSTLLFLESENNFNYVIFLIFFVGILSDLNILKSPHKRFILQVAIILVLTFLSNNFISSIRIPLFDHLLTHTFFKYFFVVFCLLILINGSNFLDGLNGLLVGYYLLISLIFYQLNFIEFLEIENSNLLFFSMTLFILFIFNFFNKSFMGDTGAYILGFFYGYLLIKIYVEHQIFSPFFVILLFWYPCFENLFSILRKFKLKRSPIEPDNNHLHQLIFFYLKKKYKIKNIFANNYGSLIILLYNLIIFGFGIQNISNTQYQVILIILNLFIYCAIYFKLFAYKYNLKI